MTIIHRDGVKARDAAAKIVAEFPKANVRAGRKEDLPINDVCFARANGP